MKNRLVVARNWRGMGPEGSGKKVKVAQSSPTLCDPMDDTPQCSSVYGLLQVIILEWVAISFSRGSSWPRNWTQVSCITGRFFTMWATREPEKEVWWGGAIKGQDVATCGDGSVVLTMSGSASWLWHGFARCYDWGETEEECVEDTTTASNFLQLHVNLQLSQKKFNSNYKMRGTTWWPSG